MSDAAEKPARLVINDAIWVVEKQDYVDLEPPVEKSLFDNPDALDRAWDLTVSSLKRGVEERKAAASSSTAPPDSDTTPDSDGGGPADSEAPRDELVERYHELEKQVREKRRPQATAGTEKQSDRPEAAAARAGRVIAHVASSASRLLRRA